MSILVAQWNPGGAAGLVGAVLIALLVFIAIALAIVICFLLTLQKALSRCSPRNRTMSPGLVWLNLVPCLSLVWQFITAIKIADSLNNEYYQRGLGDGGDYSKGLGIAYACMGVVNIFVGQVIDNLAVDIGFLVCYLVIFICYWVKVAGLSRRLIHDNLREYDDDDYNFNDDSDNPLPRRDRHDDYGDDERAERPRKSLDYDHDQDEHRYDR